MIRSGCFKKESPGHREETVFAMESPRQDQLSRVMDVTIEKLM